jgi:hypothetical protein
LAFSEADFFGTKSAFEYPEYMGRSKCRKFNGGDNKCGKL